MARLAADHTGEAVEHLFEGLLLARSGLAGQYQCHRLGDRCRVFGGPGPAVHSNQ
jgi:hypothetical protein